MAEIFKPTSLSNIWANSGDKIKPSDEKIQIGWQVEIPARQHFNWLENRRDTAIAHFNQRGIPQWDALTEYIAHRSYVQAADGRVYKCVISNRGKDPMVDSIHWIIAFASNDDALSRKAFIGFIASSGDIIGSVNYKYYFTNSAKLTIPKVGERGDAIIVAKSPEADVLVVVEDGSDIHTHLGGYDSVMFDIYDEVNFVHNGVQWEVV